MRWNKVEEIGFLEKTKGFLIRPTATFKKVKEEPVGSALKYFVIWLLIYAILSAIIFVSIGNMLGAFSPLQSLSTLGLGAGEILALWLFIIILVGGLVGIFISAGIIHIGVLIVGGKQGYHQTLKALAYGNTPTYVLGWIPIVMFITAIWALILEILGIRELHEMSTGKAVLAVLIPLIIFGVILSVIIAATVYIYVSGMIGGP